MLELELPVDTLLQSTLSNCQWCRKHFRSLSNLESTVMTIHSRIYVRSSTSAVGSDWISSDGELKRWDIGRSRFESNEILRPRLQRNNSSPHVYSLFKHRNTSISFNEEVTPSTKWSRPAILLVRTLQLAPKLLGSYSHSTLSAATTALTAVTAANNISAAKTAEPFRPDDFAATVDELLTLVALRANSEECIVLTFADNKWLNLLLNWMISLHEVCENEYCSAIRSVKVMCDLLWQHRRLVNF